MLRNTYGNGRYASSCWGLTPYFAKIGLKLALAAQGKQGQFNINIYFASDTTQFLKEMVYSFADVTDPKSRDASAEGVVVEEGHGATRVNKLGLSMFAPSDGSSGVNQEYGLRLVKRHPGPTNREEGEDPACLSAENIESLILADGTPGIGFAAETCSLVVLFAAIADVSEDSTSLVGHTEWSVSTPKKTMVREDYKGSYHEAIDKVFREHTEWMEENLFFTEFSSRVRGIIEAKRGLYPELRGPRTKVKTVTGDEELDALAGYESIELDSNREHWGSLPLLDASKLSLPREIADMFEKVYVPVTHKARPDFLAIGQEATFDDDVDVASLGDVLALCEGALAKTFNELMSDEQHTRVMELKQAELTAGQKRAAEVREAMRAEAEAKAEAKVAKASAMVKSKRKADKAVEAAPLQPLTLTAAASFPSATNEGGDMATTALAFSRLF